LPDIETNLSFFKSFAINLSIVDENDELNSIRQDATNPHKDKNDCKYTFCVIVVFGNFEGEDLVLSKIGIVIEVKCG
ncbi:18303_t:CDS:1, partial [Funneliformis geosporum]